MFKRILNTLLLTFSAGALPGLAAAGKVLVLPLSIDTTRIKDHQVVQDFFFEAVDAHTGGNAIRGKSDTLCTQRDCALALAASAQADQVIYGQVRFLGRKCFFTGNIVGAKGESPFSQTINLLGVADFENGTKRMAASMLDRVVIEKSADVDNITEREEVDLPRRRRSFYSIGGSLGYIYPFNGSFQRWEEDYDYSCTSSLDCRTELESYRQMVVLEWNNWFEFRSNLAMEANFRWAMPLAVGVDFNLDYLFGRGDFTPFAGGGLGLHYVGADEGIHKNNDKMNSGPTVNVQGGMIFFRTYSVNMVAKGTYHMILNSDKDHGAGMMLGLRTKF